MHNAAYEQTLDLRRWRSETGEHNEEQMARLLAHLPQAMKKELTERQQLVLEMYFFRNMTQTEIARTLQVHPSTVQRTLRRASLRLQRVRLYTV